jgi:hypothetical protein
MVNERRTYTVVDGKAQTNIVRDIPIADEVCRWVTYVVVDGEIAWSYTLSFKPDDRLDSIQDSKSDAKEYDPKFEKVIEEVNVEVGAEMKKQGTYQKFGSVHQFWGLKKEKLKARGIEWRSPSELNPNAIYD